MSAGFKEVQSAEEAGGLLEGAVRLCLALLLVSALVHGIKGVAIWLIYGALEILVIPVTG